MLEFLIKAEVIRDGFVVDQTYFIGITKKSSQECTHASY